MRSRPYWFVLVAPLAQAACGSSQRGEPLAPPVVLRTAQEERGQRVFHEFCHQCHPSGAGGLGPGINDKPLPKAAITLQVRKGLGDMPAFSSEVLSSAELDAIVAYLSALRASR